MNVKKNKNQSVAATAGAKEIAKSLTEYSQNGKVHSAFSVEDPGKGPRFCGCGDAFRAVPEQ